MTTPTASTPSSPVLPTAAEALVQLALATFDQAVDGQNGFRSRPGQRQMAERVAATFSQADLGSRRDAAAPVLGAAPVPGLPGNDSADDADGPPPQRRFAVIQAGTGVGKSLAYSAPAIALALARNTRVLISTATVALQEQLVNKDLPALAAALASSGLQPFRFALAKGRGRYVCQLKLDRLAGGDPQEPDDLFADDPLPSGSGAVANNAIPSSAGGTFDDKLSARHQAWAAMGMALASGTWDGDRDSLPTAPEGDVWQPVAAEAASCTGKHCPLFNRCNYFEQRKALVGAQIIVANHDLLLSSLGSRVLPELDHCLLVLDEAHHLPGVAQDQFTRSMDLTRLRWVDQLAQRATQVGAALYLSDALEAPQLAAALKVALQDLARATVDTLRPTAPPPAPTAARRPAPNPAFKSADDRVRPPKGVLPDAMLPPLDAVVAAADAWLVHLSGMARTLKAEIKDKPEDARRLSNLYAHMGTLAPRLEAVADTAKLLLSGHELAAAPTTSGLIHPNEAPPETRPQVPVAKWFTFDAVGDGPQATLHIKAFACPTLPGTVLRQHLWPRVRSAVLTSATLTSCGRFDFFLAECGLSGDPDASALAVPSPFDFATQGRFEVVETRNDPREAAAFTREMIALLMADLAGVQDGALVLFTSRDQMRQAVTALPDRLRPYVLVQGDWPRTVLLQRHRQAVARGDASIIFGMQSFGEGLDLPGKLCATLFIAKLPFAPPDDPVGEARAEWLEAQGRNPFNELVVPATSVRLAQWAGRAIRTETDQARIVCYDRRLLRTPYGQRLMQGLPPFAQSQRASNF